MLLGLDVIPHNLKVLTHAVNVVVLEMVEEVPLPLEGLGAALDPAWEHALLRILKQLLVCIELRRGVKVGPAALVPPQQLAMHRELVLRQLALGVVGLVAVMA